MGTDGFEFLEFSSLKPENLATLFKQLGFSPIAKHRSKQVTLYRQGDINFILNSQKNSQAQQHAHTHGDGACAMGFRVKDANVALQRAISLGAEPFHSPIKAGELEIPAISAIGGSVIYFIDRYGDEATIYDADFEPIKGSLEDTSGAGLTYIDHLTHNVYQGHMDTWTQFYTKIFNFYEIRYFDIKGEQTGLISRALSSPCGKIKIPINEGTDPKSQIEEFLQAFNGEGIQHIALGTGNIYDSTKLLRESGIKFLGTPDTYYEMIHDRINWHQEDIAQLQKDKILIDGGKNESEGLLLQIFTENLFGPQFIEIIQRKGDEGFGEGNFTALFKAIEGDQIKRGVLKIK